MDAQAIIRSFDFGGKYLEDPDPNMAPHEVLAYYSTKYPELTTATVGGPKFDGPTAVYKITTTIGDKG